MNFMGTVKIDMNELFRLRDLGYSRAKLADHFGVSDRTVQNYLRYDPVNQFANKLTSLIADAPEGYCRKELQKLINDLRTFKTSTIEEKKAKILKSLKSEACEIEEIAEDCALSETEVLDLLKDLQNEQRVAVRIQQKKIRYFFNEGSNK